MARARTLILRLIKPELAVLEEQGLLLDAKSRLQHMVQARWHNPPRYQTLGEGDPDSEHRFAVAVYAGERRLAEGTGRSKRRAQQNAALKALDVLTTNFPQGEA
jgi:ribonuclease-3